MPKKKSFKCLGCDNEFTIQHKTKDPAEYCPFCGDEITPVKLDRPLLTSFDELDEFNEEEYYDEESEDDPE